MKKTTLLFLLISPFLISAISCNETGPGGRQSPNNSSADSDNSSDTSQAKRGDELIEAILTNARENNLKPDLEALVTQTTALKSAAAEYCPSDNIADMDNSKLQNAQDAWKKALLTLKKVEVFYLGPYSDKQYYPPLNKNVMRYRLDFIPSNVSTRKSVDSILGKSDAQKVIEEKVASETDAHSPKEWTFGEIGFPAIEYLLFSDTPKTKSSYCQYVRAVTTLAESDVKKLQKRWWNEEAPKVASITEFDDALKNHEVLGKGFYYWLLHPGTDPRRQIVKWQISMQYFVDGLGHLVEFANGKNRLNVIQGGGTQQYPYAKVAIRGILQNIETLQRIYLNKGGDESESLSAVVQRYIDKDKKENAKLDNAIRNNLKNIITGLTGKDDSYLDNPRIVSLSTEMQMLATNLKQILTSLGLKATKADADGD